MVLAFLSYHTLAPYELLLPPFFPLSVHLWEIARCVQKDNGVTALAHVTCVSTPRAQIHRTLALLREAGVENILALRGDLPADGSPACADFAHASDLI